MEAAPQPQRPASVDPATRTDRLPPGIGEAIQKVRKELTKDVRKFLRAKHRADKSSEELATFDDEKTDLAERNQTIHVGDYTGGAG